MSLSELFVDILIVTCVSPWFLALVSSGFCGGTCPLASRVISCSPWQCLSYPSGPPRDFPSVDLHHCRRYGKSRSAAASLSRCRDEGLLCFYSPLPSTNPPPASTIFLGPDEGQGLAESPSRQGNSPGQGRGQSAGCWVTERRFTCLFFLLSLLCPFLGESSTPASSTCEAQGPSKHPRNACWPPAMPAVAINFVPTFPGRRPLEREMLG